MSIIDSFSGQHRFLSNFTPATVAWLGVACPSVEHAYQLAKCSPQDPAYGWLVVEMRDAGIKPGQAKRLGQQITLREDWEQIKVDVMRCLLMQKFAPDSPLAHLLLQTGDAELIEGNTWGDTFWGVCRGEGFNYLGRLLMQRRAELLLITQKQRIEP